MASTRQTTSRPGRPERTGGAQRAKVFWTGRSQAVRLPKEFRFTTAEVTVRRAGRRVILEPVEVERDAQGWPLVFWQLAGAWPEFSVEPRPAEHERGDVLAGRR